MAENKKLIAMLGGGQLGLMFTQSAHELGQKVLILDPDKDCPAGKIADKFLNADYSDKDALNFINKNCDVCTTEFENIPYKTLQFLEENINVFPNSKSLKISQNRILEKKFLKKIGIPTTEYFEIKSKEDLKSLKNIKNWPYIIKTSTFGYDGKGQKVVNNFEELNEAYHILGSHDFVLEKKVDLKKEVSQVAAAYDNNEIVYLPISENIHISNILHKSFVPAKINDSSNFFIKNITKKIIKELGYKGIICIEFFIDNKNNILVNEIAPRTHNSGHYSIEGCNISQFEHQVKIMTNQIPKNSNLITPSVMINLLGEIWQDKKPDFDKITSNNVFLHLYNKRIPKKGRKMGHITITNNSLKNANAIADEIYKVLKSK